MRKTGLDIIRCCAIFFVISVHYISYSGYYDIKLIGSFAFFVTMLRWLFYTCVPLFLILTGYLLNNRKLNLGHYKKIIRVLFEYFIACILCNLYKIIIMKEKFTILGWISSITGFWAAPYSWYINMYIGLFLIIPFLNLIYNNLDNKRQKRILLLILIFLVSMPKLCNISFVIFPDWWIDLYPILYYFIGCYIYEYSIELSKVKIVLCIIICLIIQSSITFCFTDNGVFNELGQDGYGTFFTVIISTCVFILLYNINTQNKLMHTILGSISKCTLSMYLISWVFDKIVYNYFNVNISENMFNIKYYPLITILILGGSYIVSLIIVLLYDILLKILNRYIIKNK